VLRWSQCSHLGRAPVAKAFAAIDADRRKLTERPAKDHRVSYTSQSLDAVFTALADPTRRAMLAELLAELQA
jgi:hypothetical protein